MDYSKDDLENRKQEIKSILNLPDEGIEPLPADWWDQKVFKDWKDAFFNRALFPLDPRIKALPYGCKYGDDNRMLQELCYPDRLKPDWELAKKLVRENAPQHLYKYRMVNAFSLQNLMDDTLWVTRAENFNDPFDCVSVEEIIDPDEFRADLRANRWRRRGWIGSLSETKDSILMWSYYADCHRGFCIEYDTLQLYESSSIRHNMYPMNYWNPEPWNDSATGFDWLSLFISLRKSAQWEHEKEWRIIYPERVIEGNGNDKGWNLKMQKPTAVYLGALMTPDDKNEVVNICRNKGIPIFVEHLDYSSMTISFQESD